MKMWRCSRCRETVPEDFDLCWHCGGKRDGTPTQVFQAEPDDPPVPDSGVELMRLQGKEVPTMQTEKVYAQPQRGHVSLGGALRALLFLVPVIVLGLILLVVIRPTTEAGVFAAVVPELVFAVFWAILVSGVRVAAQWERGVVL